MLFCETSAGNTSSILPFKSLPIVEQISNTLSVDRDFDSVLLSGKVIDHDNELEKTYSKSAIDQCVVDRMWVLFSCSATDTTGKPIISKTIKEEIEVRELSVKESPTVEKIKFLHMRKRLYKGCNKQLPLPIILMRGSNVFKDYKYNQLESARKGKITTLYCVSFPHNEQRYKLTEENLIKHMGYDPKSAKCFVREHKRWGYDFYFLKEEIDDCWGVLRGNTKGDFIWDKSPGDSGVFRGTEKGKDFSNFADACDFSLPITSLRMWKEIAKDCYESNHPDRSFYDLATATQTRFLVNTIRHNSFYEQSYNFSSAENMKIIRDKALSSIMREIAWRFPLLRNEVTTQLNEKFTHWA